MLNDHGHCLHWGSHHTTFCPGIVKLSCKGKGFDVLAQELENKWRHCNENTGEVQLIAGDVNYRIFGECG